MVVAFRWVDAPNHDEVNAPFSQALSCFIQINSSVCDAVFAIVFGAFRVYKNGSAAHRPPEGRAGHRAGGEETDSGGQFCVPRGQCAVTGRRRVRYVEECRPERTHGEQLRG